MPASHVVHVPEAQGGLPPGPHVLYVLGTRIPLSCVPCVPSTVARHSVARQTVARRVRVRVRVLRLASYHPQAMHNDLLNRALKRGMKVGANS